MKSSPTLGIMFIEIQHYNMYVCIYIYIYTHHSSTVVDCIYDQIRLLITNDYNIVILYNPIYIHSYSHCFQGASEVGSATV